MGPNVRRLVAHKMARDAVPPGGGLADAMRFLTTPGAVVAGAHEATEWVRLAIQTVKDAPGNPYGDDDEAIAGEILRQIELRTRKP
jgi:hypothetical protein